MHRCQYTGIVAPEVRGYNTTMQRWFLAGLLALALCVEKAPAHHSLTGVYDTSREITLEGTVTRFEFVNPHPFVTISVEVRGEDKQLWRLEMDNRSELSQIGVTSGTLKAGDRVVVAGSPGRTQARSMYLRKLDRPADGLRYEQIGSTPYIKFGK